MLKTTEGKTLKGFTRYKEIKDLMTDLDLGFTEIDFLHPLLFQYGEILYNKKKNIVLLDTKILSAKGNFKEKGITFKVRILKEYEA